MSLNTPQNLRVAGEPRAAVLRAAYAYAIAAIDHDPPEKSEDELDDAILAYIKARNKR